MNNKVVVDIDGVIADFEGAFCEEFGYERRELVSLESRYPNRAIEISKFINNGFVYKKLQPYDLGLDIVDYLMDYGMEVHIVSSRPYFLEGVTRTWLKRHGVNYTSLTLNTQKTGEIALIKPLCAVDDLFSVHMTLKRHNIPTIIVAQPWNNYIGEKMIRISNLIEFLGAFDRILKGKA